MASDRNNGSARGLEGTRFSTSEATGQRVLEDCEKLACGTVENRGQFPACVDEVIEFWTTKLIIQGLVERERQFAKQVESHLGFLKRLRRALNDLFRQDDHLREKFAEMRRE